MLIRWGLKQSFRTPRRLAAYFLVITVVCAFLCIGLNMKKMADDNLQAVLDNFKIVALPDFKASITEDGSLATDAEASVGYYSCWAEDYDLEALSAMPGVKRIDVRNKFGAYVRSDDGTLAHRKCNYSDSYIYNGCDVVIFEVTSSQPVVVGPMREVVDAGGHIKAYGQLYSIPANVLWSAAGRDLSIKTVNLYDAFRKVYTFEPGVTYIANIGRHNGLDLDIYHGARELKVSPSGAFTFGEEVWRDETYSDMFPSYCEYYEGFWATDIGAYYRQAAEAVMLHSASLTAITTDNMDLIPAFMNGHIKITGGRGFTQEEYDSGEKVCIVSSYLSKHTGLQLGDTIDFSFYETEYLFSRTIKGQVSSYAPHLFVSDEEWEAGQLTDFPLDHLFGGDTYTIVGIYDGQVKDPSADDKLLYNETLDWQMVLFPNASIQGQPAPKLSQYMTTIELEPLMIQKFRAAVQMAGLLEEQSGDYQLGLTIEDYGLTGMLDGLEALQQVSKLTLMLSVITAALSVIVLSILHLLQSRRQIAGLRSMGVKKGQVAACILSGILLVCLLGAVTGAYIGETLSADVTQSILDTARGETMDSSFSAMLAADDDVSDDFQLEAAADTRLTWWAAGMVSAAMVLISVSLVLWEAQKPPLLMLGVKE